MNLIGVWIAGLLTLAIFSFLYRDNPLYKAAEHLYVGTSAAFWLIYIWSFTLYPLLFKPLQSRPLAPDLWIPLILGVMMLTRLIPKSAWISRTPMAFMVGLGAGLALTGTIQGTLFPQLKATIVSLNPTAPWPFLQNLLIVIGVITTVIYFFFSREHTGAFGLLAKIGTVFIMVSFGAVFGSTVMARVSILIGRVAFILTDWLKVIR